MKSRMSHKASKPARAFRQAGEAFIVDLVYNNIKSYTHYPFCPVSDPLPSGWYAPVTVLPCGFYGFYEEDQLNLFEGSCDDE